ncbi:MAG: hypothetical protein IJ193_01800, partial [Bacilli bacterium]|nr:hypothetical protein [Bacilli bacterium]
MKKFKWNRTCTILVLIMFITITFASFNTDLFINGKAYIRVDSDIRITDIKLVESESSAYETYAPEYTKDSISINSNLPKQNSTLTYQITIKNSSNDDYDVQNIIEQTYSNTNISYEITGLTVDDTILEANTTSTFLLKLTNNTTIVEEEDKYETKEYIFDYTGSEQVFIVPYDGDYTLEVWGAQGGYGCSEEYHGGYGGYSKGTIRLRRNKKIYINVGGAGSNGLTKTTEIKEGGYNGGGLSKGGSDKYVGAGGGATHISSVPGLLSTLESQKNHIYIVAGGGGGGGYEKSVYYSLGGSGGGIQGNDADLKATGSYLQYVNGKGGTQTAGGSGHELNEMARFGAGAVADGNAIGGGGGYYGGGAGLYCSGGGGGSGYIGNPLLTNKEMYCYNCTESNAEETKTISTENHSSTPISNYAKEGNGFVKITLTRKIENSTQFDYYYEGFPEKFKVPYDG